MSSPRVGGALIFLGKGLVMSMRDDLVVRVSRVTEMVVELDDLKRILVADIIVCRRLIDIIDAGGINEPSSSSKVGGVSGLEELKKKLLDKIKN